MGALTGAFGALDQLDHLTADSAQDRKNQEAAKQLYRNMANIPWRAASIISLHPWHLNASGVLFNELRLPPAGLPSITVTSGRKIGYSHHVFANWVKNARPNDAGALEFNPVLPIDLALDFIAQHQNFQRQGGLLAYESISTPEVLDPKEPCFIVAMPTGGRPPTLPFVEALEAAHEQQVKFYLKMHSSAEEAWAKPDKRGLHIITPNVRRATRLLREWGYLQQDPEWMKKTARPGPNAPVPIICRACKTESNPGAVKCTACNEVFKPYYAFSNLIIDLQTPGARLALRRLSVEERTALIKEKVFTLDAVEECLGYAVDAVDEETKSTRSKKHQAGS